MAYTFGDAGISRLFVVDGDNLLHRCYYAAHGNGMAAQMRILLNILIGQIYNRRAGLALVVWDGGRAAWREQIFHKYKERSSSKQDELGDISEFRKSVVELLGLMGIAQLRIEGVEADDVISYAARAVRHAKIYSNDSDFLMIVSDQIALVRPQGKETVEIGAHNFHLHAPVDSPVKYRLYKAIVGDKSDNVPGVKGAGKKTAVELISQLSDAELEAHPELAIIRKSEAATGRLRRVADNSSAFMDALRVTDLTSVCLLPHNDVVKISVALASSPPIDQNLGWIEKMRAYGISAHDIPSRQLLENRVRQLRPSSYSLAWARYNNRGVA